MTADRRCDLARLRAPAAARLRSITLLAVALSTVAAYGQTPARSDIATAPTASTRPSAPAHAAAAPGAPVRIHDTSVFVVTAARNGQSAEERARNATQVLERLAESGEAPPTRVETHADNAVVFAGERPVIQLGPDDAPLGVPLDVHAATIAARVRDGLRGEQKRNAIATAVFSFSLLVFSALIALLLLRKVGDLIGRARDWINAHPERIPEIRVLGIEVIRKNALRGGVSLALGAGRALGQLGVAYAWLLFALSLFESTRGYSERLTGFVLRPLSTLMGRAASSLPLLVLAAIAVVMMVMVVRFVGLFFGSIARGETAVGWLPADLAAPTSVLVRGGIVLVSIVVAAPLITGNDDGALSRAGAVALVAVGLACTPMLACAAVGVAVVFARRLRAGDYAEVGGRAGKIVATTLLEVTLEDEFGCELRVPHLLSLFHPTRVVGTARSLRADIVIASDVSPRRARELLLEGARACVTLPRVDLVRLDADGALYRVMGFAMPDTAQSDLACSLVEVLARENIALGRSGRAAESPA